MKEIQTGQLSEESEKVLFQQCVIEMTEAQVASYRATSSSKWFVFLNVIEENG